MPIVNSTRPSLDVAVTIFHSLYTVGRERWYTVLLVTDDPGPSPGEVTVYGDLAAVADDYPEASATYRWADQFFDQEPKPTNLWVLPIPVTTAGAVPGTMEWSAALNDYIANFGVNFYYVQCVGASPAVTAELADAANAYEVISLFRNYGGDPAFLITGASTTQVTWKARRGGALGTVHSVTYADPGENNQTLSIVATANSGGGYDIVVNLATGGGGAITTTPVDIVAAVVADPLVSFLVYCEGTGTGAVAAVSHTHLAQLALPTLVTTVAENGSGTNPPVFSGTGKIGYTVLGPWGESTLIGASATGDWDTLTNYLNVTVPGQDGVPVGTTYVQLYYSANAGTDWHALTAHKIAFADLTDGATHVEEIKTADDDVGTEHPPSASDFAHGVNQEETPEEMVEWCEALASSRVMKWAHDETETYYPDAVVAGIACMMNPGSFTLKNRIPHGIPAASYTPTQQTTMRAGNVNTFFRNPAGHLNTTDEFATDGLYIDIQMAIDVLVHWQRMAIWDLLSQPPPGYHKVPYANDGFAMIEDRLWQTLHKGARPEWNFINSEDGQPMVALSCPTFVQTDVTDRQNRIYRCRWEATFKGAVHEVDVTGYLSVEYIPPSEVRLGKGIEFNYS